MDTDNRDIMIPDVDNEDDQKVDNIYEEASQVTEELYEQPQTENYTGAYEEPQDETYAKAYEQPQTETYGAYEEPQVQTYEETYEQSMRNSYVEDTDHANDEKKGRKKGHFFKKTVAAACIAAVFGCSAGAGFGFINSRLSDGENESDKKQDTAVNYSIPATVVASNSASVVSDVADVVDSVMPSVVSISCTTKVNYSTWPGYYTVQEVPSSGSGIIIGENDSELLIVTNNHVVEDSTSVSVSFIDEEVCEATVKGTDASVDIAVVSVDKSKLKKETAEKIKLATIGDSEKLRVGETAIAIGNAMGYGQSVTLGCVSALNREVTIENVTYTAIQTDAAINPGNSGGALVNAKGELIGINSAKLASTQVEGIGYAIPISKVMPIIQALMNKEYVPESERGYLGITGKTVTEQIRQMYDAPYGVIISVVEDTPVDKAGLVDYDIITKIDGVEMRTVEELIDYIGSKKTGDEVEITYQRLINGRFKEDKVNVVLDKRPDDLNQ